MTTFTAPYSLANPAQIIYNTQGEQVITLKTTPLPLAKKIVALASNLLPLPLLRSITSYDATGIPIFTLRHKLLSYELFVHSSNELVIVKDYRIQLMESGRAFTLADVPFKVELDLAYNATLYRRNERIATLQTFDNGWQRTQDTYTLQPEEDIYFLHLLAILATTFER